MFDLFNNYDPTAEALAQHAYQDASKGVGGDVVIEEGPTSNA